MYVDGPVRKAAARLRGRGMRVLATSRGARPRIAEGWVAVADLERVAALGGTRGVLPVLPGLTNTGSVTSQGDAAHRGPQARALGATGAGITVGVMSDSINQVAPGVAGSQSSGDLPPNVEILSEKASGTDEGRAMAEIVYDMAPGIPKIVFAAGVGPGIGPVERAANIDALVAHGAKVIADDTVFLTEPFFQDGVVADAADRAKANGTAYVVSAGNRARQAWNGTFTPSAVPNGNDNNFATSGPEDRRQTILTVPAGGSFTLVLQWDDPFGAATHDFALDFYSPPDAASPTASVDTNNIATGFPIELAKVTNSGAAPADYGIGIRRVAGSGSSRFRWVVSTIGTFTPAEHNTNSQAIDPDAASARGSLAVAAVAYNDPGLDSAEPFSSRGPSVTRYLDTNGVRLATPDGRAKPDIAGADGVSTSVAGFDPFFGTSAAAPSAAGVAAALLSAKPSLPIDELYAILREPANASNCTAPGFPDADCGSGFIFADGKLGEVLDASPPAVAPSVSPPAPDASNGWYRTNVGLTWAVSDTGSPVGTQFGCGPQSVTADAVATFTCSATSAGGTTNVPVTIKRDASPPSPPTFTGISARSFTQLSVPAQSAVGCNASDPTSGVDSCAVSGYGPKPGSHTLTATATNDAGLTSTSTLAYTVRVTRAISGLRVPSRVKLAKLVKPGLLVQLHVAAAATRLNLTLKEGKATVAHLVKTVGKGRARVRMKLSRMGTKRLKGARSARLALTVVGTARGVTKATLRRPFKAKH